MSFVKKLKLHLCYVFNPDLNLKMISLRLIESMRLIGLLINVFAFGIFGFDESRLY